MSNPLVWQLSLMDRELDEVTLNPKYYSTNAKPKP
jgi:hypothetical protein